MTALDIARRLANGPQDAKRTQKAKVLAQRSQIPWAEVEQALLQPMPKVRTQRVPFRKRQSIDTVKKLTDTGSPS